MREKELAVNRAEQSRVAHEREIGGDCLTFAAKLNCDSRLDWMAISGINLGQKTIMTQGGKVITGWFLFSIEDDHI